MRDRVHAWWLDDCVLPARQVNGGPALEAVALPELCDEIVNDVLQLVYDPYFRKREDDDVDGTCVEHGARAFELVYRQSTKDVCAAHGPATVCPACLDMFEPSFLAAHGCGPASAAAASTK